VQTRDPAWLIKSRAKVVKRRRSSNAHGTSFVP